MRFSAVLAPLTLAGLAFAQSNSTNSTNVVTIMVGGTASTPNGGIFQFIPNHVNATNGTVVTFRYTGMPGNHSITQSTFTDPCTDMPGGFDSGWVSIPDNGVDPKPEWNLTITNDQKPIWFFCKQLQPAPHCPAGMVGGINVAETGDHSMDNFKKAAAGVKTVDQTENGIVGVGASASQRPSPIPSGATAFPNPSITAAAGNGSSGAGGGAPASTTAPSGATKNLVMMNSGLITLVAAMTAMVLA